MCYIQKKHHLINTKHQTISSIIVLSRNYFIDMLLGKFDNRTSITYATLIYFSYK